MATVSDEGVCPEGEHEAVATIFEAKQSRSGRDMMVINFVVDHGPAAGHNLVEYVTFGLQGQMGERKLKAFCDAAGFTWRQKPSLEEFAAHFPKKQLRATLHVSHRYSLKKNGQYVDVSHEQYEDYDGEKSIMAQINGYTPAVNQPDLNIADPFERTGPIPDAEDELPF
jgi:hypothetical protein